MVRQVAVSILLWAGACGADAQPAAAPAEPPVRAVSLLEISGDMQRTRPVEPAALGFITTDAPHCLQPDPAFDACYINFQYNGVSSDQYVIWFTVSVAGRIAMRADGFVQPSFALPRNTLGSLGLRVACGLTGASGDADPMVGLSYPFTIRARDSANTNAANYGTIGCPAYFPELSFADSFE